MSTFCYRISVFGLAWFAYCLTALAQPGNVTNQDSTARIDLPNVMSTCLSLGSAKLDFQSGITDIGASCVYIQPMPFGKPVFICPAGGIQWGEERSWPGDLLVVMPEVSLGLACNVLAIPTIERSIRDQIPADLRFAFGPRVSADYVPYLEKHYFGGGHPDSLESETYHYDHASWSVHVFAAFLLDQSVGFMINHGTSWPISGEARATRRSLRFGFVFRL